MIFSKKSDKDKTIRELRQKCKSFEMENERLRRQLFKHHLSHGKPKVRRRHIMKVQGKTFRGAGPPR